MNDVATEIKQRLEFIGLSPNAFYMLGGVDPTTINRWSKGKITKNSETRIKKAFERLEELELDTLFTAREIVHGLETRYARYFQKTEDRDKTPSAYIPKSNRDRENRSKNGARYSDIAKEK